MKYKNCVKRIGKCFKSKDGIKLHYDSPLSYSSYDSPLSYSSYDSSLSYSSYAIALSYYLHYPHKQ